MPLPTRVPPIRTLALAAVLLPVLAACNLEDGSFTLGGSGQQVASRTAGHPAWGNPGWTMRYAHNGRCDDPRYEISNGGRAAPGTDEADCALYGGALLRP